MLRWSEGTLTSNEGGETTEVDEADPYGAVARHLARYDLADRETLPPFAGGAVGIFGYDLVRTVEDLGPPNPDPLGLPDLALMVCEVMLAFDHLKHELTVIAFDFSGGEDRARAEAAIAVGAGGARTCGPGARAPREPRAVEPFDSNMSREQFESNVARIVEYVHAGDAFQVVPSQRFSAPAPVEAFSIYRGLRTINPSPYMYYLEFGDFQIAGTSPESLVKVTGRTVETRPIAGTYPRGASEEEDRRNAEELLADPKERAEHVMLVDLGRNDLGRVSEYGTVSRRGADAGRGLLARASTSSAASPGTLRDGHQRARRAALGASRGDALRRAQGAGDGDHRRARAPQAGLLRWRDRLRRLRRRPRHRDPHPHGRRQGRPGPRAGRRRHGRRRQARLRVPRVAGEGGGRSSARSGWLRARRSGSSHMRVLVIDNYDSFTYNLVQFLGELGAEVEVVRNDKAERRRAARARSRAPGDLAGTLHTRRRRDLDRGLARLPRGRRADARRLPRPPVDGRGVRRPDDPRRADPRQGRRGRARRHRHLRGPARTRSPPPATTRSSPTRTCPTSSSRPRRSAKSSWASATARSPPRASRFHPESVLTPQGKELLRNFLER